MVRPIKFLLAITRGTQIQVPARSPVDTLVPLGVSGYYKGHKKQNVKAILHKRTRY